MKHAFHIGTTPVHGGVNRRFRGDRSLACDAFARKIDRADIFWLRQYAGESWINEKSFSAGNMRAQVTRAGQHSLAGEYL